MQKLEIQSVVNEHCVTLSAIEMHAMKCKWESLIKLTPEQTYDLIMSQSN